MRCLPLLVVLALLPVVLSQHVSLHLEHALDGARFTPAGRIFGNLEVEEVSSSETARAGLDQAALRLLLSLCLTGGWWLLAGCRAGLALADFLFASLC